MADQQEAGVDFHLGLLHPLDHSILSRKCKDSPGGRRRHVRYRWTFHIQPVLESWLYRPLCAVGKHKWLPVWDDDGPIVVACWVCEAPADPETRRKVIDEMPYELEFGPKTFQ